MILIGRGLNLRESSSERSESEAAVCGRKRRAGSVQVNSNCAVVKVRINSVRQKEVRTHAAKAQGEREIVQTKRKPDGQKRKAGTEVRKLKAAGRNESS